MQTTMSQLLHLRSLLAHAEMAADSLASVPAQQVEFVLGCALCCMSDTEDTS